MKIHCVFRGVDYEGKDLIAAYSSHESAKAAVLRLLHGKDWDLDEDGRYQLYYKRYDTRLPDDEWYEIEEMEVQE